MSDHTEATIRASSDNCGAGPDCRICRDVRPLLCLLDEVRAERDALRRENSTLIDKALEYDLDRCGIEQRSAEAVELVELRAQLAALIDLADTDPFTSIGHAIEHTVPNARAVLARAAMRTKP